MSTAPLEDALAEARRLIAMANEQGHRVRVFGGVAVRLLVPKSSRDSQHKDIDLIAERRARDAVEQIADEAGYVPQQRFNALHGRARLRFDDPVHARELEVYLDEVRMCHVLDLARRLPPDGLTIEPTDLLLTKLQMVEPTDRDLEDARELVRTIDLDEARLAQVVGHDWGWWRTVHANLEQLVESTTDPPAHARLRQLIDVTDRAPKSLSWRARARIGDRLRWYATPEEG